MVSQVCKLKERPKLKWKQTLKMKTKAKINYSEPIVYLFLQSGNLSWVEDFLVCLAPQIIRSDLAAKVNPYTSQRPTRLDTLDLVF